MAISAERIEAHAEVFKSLIPTVIKDNLSLFLHPDDPRKWQPSDLFPDVARDGVSVWQDRCAEIRQQAQTMSKSLRVVIAGNGITEAGLSLFSAAYARIRGLEDITGIDDNPWAQSRRWWLGDENRHHEGTYTYASLSGIYDMRAIDRTIHIFHRNGFDNKAGLDPYTNLFFVVNQESDTFLAHQRSALMSRDQQEAAGVRGESIAFKLLMGIASEEAVHAVFFGKIFGGVVEHDPAGAIIAIRDMVKIGTIMPGEYMGALDGTDQIRSSTLFKKYARVASRLGILTLLDDVEHTAQALNRWEIADLKVSGEAAQAQEDIFRLQERRKKSAQQLEEKKIKQNTEEEMDVSDFDWLAKDAA